MQQMDMLLHFFAICFLWIFLYAEFEFMITSGILKSGQVYAKDWSKLPLEFILYLLYIDINNFLQHCSVSNSS